MASDDMLYTGTIFGPSGVVASAPGCSKALQAVCTPRGGLRMIRAKVKTSDAERGEQMSSCHGAFIDSNFSSAIARSAPTTSSKHLPPIVTAFAPYHEHE